MIFPHGTMQATDHETASEVVYDAVIVGSGISGAIIANELSRAGMRVLILEAGPDDDRDLRDYEHYLNRFYETPFKDNKSPYPVNPEAPMPRSTDARTAPAGPAGRLRLPRAERARSPLDSTYTRVLGGTTMHWEAKTLRMLPEDFETADAATARASTGRSATTSSSRTTRQAEREIGVSADVDDQEYARDQLRAGLRVPDARAAAVVSRPDGGQRTSTAPRSSSTASTYTLQGARRSRRRATASRNPAYDGGKGYTPVGAVSTHAGRARAGAARATPTACRSARCRPSTTRGKTLAKALAAPAAWTCSAQTVASRGCTRSRHTAASRTSSTRPTTDPARPARDRHASSGRLFVLAANAIENAAADAGLRAAEQQRARRAAT